jgi:flagellar protein FliS
LLEEADRLLENIASAWREISGGQMHAASPGPVAGDRSARG